MNNRDKTTFLISSRFLLFSVILMSLVTGCGSPTMPVVESSPTDTQETLVTPSVSPTIADSTSFQKGITFVSWQSDEYSSSAAEQSLADLASTGANWVAILVTVYQKTAADTQILATGLTPTDDGLTHIISKTHELGLQVLLKPHIDIESGEWRGEITFSTENEWKAWFDSYRQIINHYAELAQQTQTEAFSVGTELVNTSKRSADWEDVIAEVRTRFTGKLTYASNFDEVNNVKWWGSVDYIGVDAYYPLPTSSDHPTVNELKTAWTSHLKGLKQLSEEYYRPILLTEIGYRPVKGANRAPWEWQEFPEMDLALQANLYEAALETFPNEEWVAGMFFWNWLVNPDQGGVSDLDYTPKGKPAEDVLRNFYNQ